MLLDRRQRVLAGDLDLAHVADVEQPGPRAHGQVLVGDAGVFDRHVPAAELDHAGAKRSVPGMEWRLLERTGWRLGHRVDQRSAGRMLPATCGIRPYSGKPARARSCTREPRPAQPCNGTMRLADGSRTARTGPRRATGCHRSGLWCRGGDSGGRSAGAGLSARHEVCFRIGPQLRGCGPSTRMMAEAMRRHSPSSAPAPCAPSPSASRSAPAGCCRTSPVPPR